MRRHGSAACLDCQLGRKAVLAEQFARPFIPARLDQQIEDFAILVDGAP